MHARSSALLLAAMLAVFSAHVAVATPAAGLAPPTIDINGTTLDGAALGCAPRNGLFECGGQNLAGDGYVLDSWAFLLDPDPSITATFTLTNISAATRTIVLTWTLPVAPTGPSLLASGFIGPGTLTDLNANGATLTDDGSSIYTARIDGSPVRTLLDPPQSFTAPADPFGLPSSVPIPLASFGPETLAQSANTTISMRIEFTLTAGDQVLLPAFFEVQPIPEPGTLVLLGSGLAGLVGARRRRSPS